VVFASDTLCSLASEYNSVAGPRGRYFAASFRPSMLSDTPPPQSSRTLLDDFGFRPSTEPVQAGLRLYSRPLVQGRIRNDKSTSQLKSAYVDRLSQGRFPVLIWSEPTGVSRPLSGTGPELPPMTVLWLSA
jgi:hypothetical protein